MTASVSPSTRARRSRLRTSGSRTSTPGNAFVQLVEPLEDGSDLAKWLQEHGEGLHHICFGVDDVADAVATLSDDGSPGMLGTGRGRVSGFVTTSRGNGVRIECTEFDQALDVEGAPGWLAR